MPFRAMFPGEIYIFQSIFSNFLLLVLAVFILIAVLPRQNCIIGVDSGNDLVFINPSTGLSFLIKNYLLKEFYIQYHFHFFAYVFIRFESGDIMTLPCLFMGRKRIEKIKSLLLNNLKLTAFSPLQTDKNLHAIRRRDNNLTMDLMKFLTKVVSRNRYSYLGQENLNSKNQQIFVNHPQTTEIDYQAEGKGFMVLLLIFIIPIATMLGLVLFTVLT
jgi:hypothetical protein